MLKTFLIYKLTIIKKKQCLGHQTITTVLGVKNPEKIKKVAQTEAEKAMAMII